MGVGGQGWHAVQQLPGSGQPLWRQWSLATRDLNSGNADPPDGVPRGGACLGAARSPDRVSGDLRPARPLSRYCGHACQLPVKPKAARRKNTRRTWDVATGKDAGRRALRNSVTGRGLPACNTGRRPPSREGSVTAPCRARRRLGDRQAWSSPLPPRGGGDYSLPLTLRLEWRPGRRHAAAGATHQEAGWPAAAGMEVGRRPRYRQRAAPQPRTFP
jgi:hypothetical protein